MTRLGASYHIDKVDFLQAYLKARRDVVTPKIIRQAWTKAGFFPFDPQLILKEYPLPEQNQPSESIKQYNITIRRTTPPEGTVIYSSPEGNFDFALTPGNIAEVEAVIHRQKEEHKQSGQFNAIDVIDVLERVGKAAKIAIADKIIYSKTTAELYDLNQLKKAKGKRTRGNYGYAQVMSADTVRARNDQTAKTAAAKEDKRILTEWNTEWNRIKKVGPGIVTWRTPFRKRQAPVTPRRLPAKTPQRPSTIMPSRPPAAPPRRPIGRRVSTPSTKPRQMVLFRAKGQKNEVQNELYEQKEIQGPPQEDNVERYSSRGRLLKPSTVRAKK